MAQNVIEKIAERYAVDLEPGHQVHSGDFLSIRPAHVMTHDNTAAVIPKFRSMGARNIFDPSQPVFALDHDIQNDSAANRAKYRDIEAFAAEQDVVFHGAGRGIGHQVMMEEGFVLPGTFVVASDSHSNIYGALGALGTPVVRTDAAAIWATGRTWWQVPDVVRVVLRGSLRPGVSGKDVILALIGRFDADEVLNSCIEFAGPGLAALSMEQRMTIANMTTEWGALAGVFAYDDTTRRWLHDRAAVLEQRDGTAARLTRARLDEVAARNPMADDDASYALQIDLDLDAVSPFVAGPDAVKTLVPVPEIEARQVRIDKAFLLSCVNARLEDFAAAAHVLQGRHIAEHVQLFIAAASSTVEQQAREAGTWQILQEAGATALPPGCGPCIGLGQGLLDAGEVGISATNRNFKGRMGSRDASVYLASPAVVAASALKGWIAAPDRGAADEAADDAAGRAPGSGSDTSRQRLQAGSRLHQPPAAAHSTRPVSILDGFPRTLEGELLLVPQNNLNTDGIYGKDWTYKEGMTPEEMASKAMLNYDPQFQEIAQDGDLLVGGANFGAGSSREQAATCLKYRGIRMVLAASFSQTYKRNAFNNGFIVVECPELVADLFAAHADDAARTIRTGQRTRVDFVACRIDVDGHTYRFAPLGRVAQELVAQGGFETVIRQQISQLERKDASDA
jgi:homoaconitate hydratase